MRKENVVSLQWHGRDTVGTVRQIIAHRGRIVLRFATNLNHALFRKLHPQAMHGAVEQLDCAGDAGLLQTISEIRGLEDLAPLADVLRAADARVHVLSPPRLVIDVREKALPAGSTDDAGCGESVDGEGRSAWTHERQTD
jgi:hypothetical protein